MSVELKEGGNFVIKARQFWIILFSMRILNVWLWKLKFSGEGKGTRGNELYLAPFVSEGKGWSS